MGKNVLISGYIGFQNFGDDAILLLLTRYLKSKGCNITALSSNPEITNRVFKIQARHYMNVFDILNAIANTSVLISGGGSLIQNGTSSLSLLYYLTIIFLAKLFGKKVIIFAQGIGPIHGKFYQWLSKRVLKMCDLILVRDVFSQRILKRWGIHSRFVADPVWDIQLPKYEPMGYVGVQLRHYRFLHENLIKELARYVGIYFSDRKIKIFSFQHSKDSDLCYEFDYHLKAQCPEIVSEVVVCTSHKQLLEEFSHLEYLFAMRYHAVLIALKMGIKVLPVSYDVKVKNLADEFNIPYVEACEDNDYYSYIRDLKNYTENEYFENRRNEGFDWDLLNRFIK